MGPLASLALAPVLICAFYMYIRDKYEREPVRLLLLGLLFGAIITFPIIHTENLLAIYTPNSGIIAEAFYDSFAVAALTEEAFKFVLLFCLVWRNDNFNERFDGIVYAVFISLGFAGLENYLYVFDPVMGGAGTAFGRAFFSVPGHALFGVAMGYYFALSKFERNNRVRLTILAFLVPFLLHGTYDFILLSNRPYTMLIFIPFVVLLWVMGLLKMKRHLQASPFKHKTNPTQE